LHFKRRYSFNNSFDNNFSTLIFESLWTSSSSFVKSFLMFSGFPKLENKTCAIHPFHSLLSLPKRIRQGIIAWILFVSLFSLFQKNEGLTALILLCLPSPFSKNSKWHSLRILLILPFLIYKIFQRTNRLRILLYPHSQSFKGLTAWELWLNTLEGTSFVVQVEGTSTWVVDWEQERVHLLWISSSGGYIHYVVQREQGRVHPMCIFTCNGILQGWKEISRTAGRLRIGCRHGLLPNQYKNSYVFVSFFPTVLISVVHFNSRFYFWLNFFSILHLLNNTVKTLEE